MTARRHRVRVVIDTNVFVRNFKARGKSGANQKIIRLWLIKKRIQLIVSADIVAEYLEIFEEVLAMEPELVSAWRSRFERIRV